MKEQAQLISGMRKHCTDLGAHWSHHRVLKAVAWRLEAHRASISIRPSPVCSCSLLYSLQVDCLSKCLSELAALLLAARSPTRSANLRIRDQAHVQRV